MNNYLTRIYLCACVLAQPIAAQISGSVTGSDGSTITQGIVTASRQPDSAIIRLGQQTASAAILPDGTFQLPALVNGTYQLCVQTWGSSWLNSCDWASPGNVVSLSTGQTSVSAPIVLVQGALVTILVSDPSGLLAQEGVTPGAHLLIGIGDAAYFHPALVTSSNAAGRTYQILIPSNKALNLSIASASFKLSNAAASALPQFGTLIPIQAQSGQQASPIALNVTGIASTTQAAANAVRKQ